LYDKIIAKEIKNPMYMKQGILFIPETASDKPFMARVVAVGEGMPTQFGKVIPTKVKPGDVVIYPTLAESVSKISNGEEEFLIMRESDVWAVVEDFED
jgi:chaperonin GroES